MESMRIYCLQLVIQEIIKTSDVNVKEIHKIGLKFGEQIVLISNKKIDFNEKREIEFKKGKICFFEEDTLGFELFIDFDKSRAAIPVSFISFEDRKDRSILRTTLELKNNLKKTIFRVSILASRHLLENLGKLKETASVGIQTPLLMKNESCQTEVKASNVGIQVNVLQKTAWTMKEEMPKTTTATQTLAPFDSREQRRQLLKIILALVLKTASVLATREVVPDEPKMDVKTAKQLSEVRKRQIEEMRERLRVMSESRKEILQESERKLGLVQLSKNKTESPKPPDLKMPKDEHKENLPDSAKQAEIIVPTVAASAGPPSKVSDNVPIVPESSLKSPSPLPSRHSSIPSPLESDVFEESERIPSPPLPEQEIVIPVQPRRKSYTLNPEASSHETQNGPIGFGLTLDPSSASRPNFITAEAKIVQPQVPDTPSAENHSEASNTESSNSTETETTSESTSGSESESESSEMSGTSASTVKAEEKRSSSSSTFGEGSISTEESIQEEIMPLKGKKSSSSSIGDDSSISEATSIIGPSPTTKYLQNKRNIPEFRRKSVHTDSVSSYAPSDM